MSISDNPVQAPQKITAAFVISQLTLDPFEAFPTLFGLILV
ncbi:MAG: hypothetical protein ACI4QC_05350 [Thermoguttaceae bacterium]